MPIYDQPAVINKQEEKAEKKDDKREVKTEKKDDKREYKITKINSKAQLLEALSLIHISEPTRPY